MKRFLQMRYKYTLPVVILLLALVADIITHKGMSRVLLPASFSKATIRAIEPGCPQGLNLINKKWVKAVNSIQRIEQLPPDAAGFEMDVYFDTAKKHLKVYHDTSVYNILEIESILKVYKKRKLTCTIWLDFKNLSFFNQAQSLDYIGFIRKEYQLSQKLIIESSSPELLSGFCANGYFTSYYVPFFNPYQLSDRENEMFADSIFANLQRYPVAALSGYYFQYPFLKKYFPQYPILSWAEKTDFSLVGWMFNRKLQQDAQLKVVLYP